MQMCDGTGSVGFTRVVYLNDWLLMSVLHKRQCYEKSMHSAHVARTSYRADECCGMDLRDRLAL